MMGPFSLSCLSAFLLLAPVTDEPPDRIVTMGDSITRGVRTGVEAQQTYAALLQDALRAKSLRAEVVNVGVGGERTDQAFAHLKDVLARKPAVVTILYGTNDSYVDRGKKEPRLTAEQYGANLKRLLAALRKAGIRPVLMTPPRWGDKAAPNGAGEHPNRRLEKYVAVCRAVARETKTPLVDHFEHWTRQRGKGVDLGKWTTDECHPNPRGHQELADLLAPVVLRVLREK